MGELATLTRLISPRQLPNSVDVCPNEAEIGHEPGEIEIGDEPGEEAASVPRLRDPGEPIQQEWDDHIKTHVPGARTAFAGELGMPRIPLSIETQTLCLSYHSITATWATVRCLKWKTVYKMTMDRLLS